MLNFRNYHIWSYPPIPPQSVLILSTFMTQQCIFISLLMFLLNITWTDFSKRKFLITIWVPLFQILPTQNQNCERGRRLRNEENMFNYEKESKWRNPNLHLKIKFLFGLIITNLKKWNEPPMVIIMQAIVKISSYFKKPTEVLDDILI